jgi:hypothetical protein
MKRIFVSYSRNNLDTVAPFIQDLQSIATDAWYDPIILWSATIRYAAAVLIHPFNMSRVTGVLLYLGDFEASQPSGEGFGRST